MVSPARRAWLNAIKIDSSEPVKVLGNELRESDGNGWIRYLRYWQLPVVEKTLVPSILVEGNLPTEVRRAVGRRLVGQDSWDIQTENGTLFGLDKWYQVDELRCASRGSAGGNKARKAASRRRKLWSVTTGSPLEERYFEAVKRCGQCFAKYEFPCGLAICPVCSLRGARRVAKKVEAFGRVNRLGLTMVTLTREQYACHPMEVQLFRLACKTMDAVLRGAGARGAGWIFEVKIKEKRSPTPCCNNETGCGMCIDAGLKFGHLHAHALVLHPKKWRTRWKALEALESFRFFDVIGRIHFKKSKSWDACGYLADYLGEQKEMFQGAWFSRLVPMMQRSWITGDIRGSVKARGRLVALGPQVEQLTRVYKAVTKNRGIRIEAAVRDIARDSRNIGFRCRPSDLDIEADIQRLLGVRHGR